MLSLPCQSCNKSNFSFFLLMPRPNRNWHSIGALLTVSLNANLKECVCCVWEANKSSAPTRVSFSYSVRTADSSSPLPAPLSQLSWEYFARRLYRTEAKGYTVDSLVSGQPVDNQQEHNLVTDRRYRCFLLKCCFHYHPRSWLSAY